MTLERWLEIATHGLAPAAASRVRREYADAFRDAYDAGERNVLAGWGDPHRVNRELRRVHLTTREARALHPGYAPTWAGLRQALGEDLGFVVGIWLYELVLNPGSTSGAERWVASGAIVLVAALRWLIVSRLSERVRGRAVAHWLLQPFTVALVLLAWTVAQAVLTGLVLPRTWEATWRLLPWGDGLAFGLLMTLLVGWVIVRHLLRLPHSLRAAAKLEGETA